LSGHDKNSTTLTLGLLIEWCGGKSQIGERQRKMPAGMVCNDSRKIGPGDVFVAIKTENDDGHRYVEAAFKAGASAAIVDRKAEFSLSAAQKKKLILVSDPVKAVQKAASRYRKEMGILFIGITGSSGKTTTRTFISSVLRQGMSVGETFGNWNNHIGVPMSILKFCGNEWAGVIEMGANHVGEIHELSLITKPDIGVITNIGYGHVGLFGSIENTCKAKFEIADGLSRGGFLLLNGDDPRLVKGVRERGLAAEFYGLSSRCSVRPENLKVTPDGLSFDVDGSRYSLQMPGRHFVYAALPAIFLGRRCGIPEKLIISALADQRPVSMRGGIEKKKGVSFIVDCYNANPSSMSSGLAYLADVSRPGSRVAIVGDMLELGKYSVKLHRELGKQIVKTGVKKLIAVGQFCHEVGRAAEKEGLPSGKIFTVENAGAAVDIARRVLCKGDTVLLKGSRGIHLETIFEKF